MPHTAVAKHRLFLAVKEVAEGLFVENDHEQQPQTTHAEERNRCGQIDPVPDTLFRFQGRVSLDGYFHGFSLHFHRQIQVLLQLDSMDQPLATATVISPFGSHYLYLIAGSAHHTHPFRDLL